MIELPVGASVLLMLETLGRWRGELRDGRTLLVEGGATPEEALAALRRAYEAMLEAGREFA
jgi:hypothetical protein